MKVVSTTKDLLPIIETILRSNGPSSCLAIKRYVRDIWTDPQKTAPNPYRFYRINWADFPDRIQRLVRNGTLIRAKTFSRAWLYFMADKFREFDLKNTSARQIAADYAEEKGLIGIADLLRHCCKIDYRR